MSQLRAALLLLSTSDAVVSSDVATKSSAVVTSGVLQTKLYDYRTNSY